MVAKKSKNLKGTYIGYINAAVASIRAAAGEISTRVDAREETHPPPAYREELNSLKREVRTMREEREALRANVERLRSALPPLGRICPSPVTTTDWTTPLSGMIGDLDRWKDTPLPPSIMKTDEDVSLAWDNFLPPVIRPPIQGHAKTLEEASSTTERDRKMRDITARINLLLDERERIRQGHDTCEPERTWPLLPIKKPPTQHYFQSTQGAKSRCQSR